ncbi:cytochrome P450 [Streptomyces sp. E11-3]|uniref:cytochrome P450 n=1 Tax=Streptomyces sp. E11-3 TaxID=3110112 RepID=UPI0039808334
MALLMAGSETTSGQIGLAVLLALATGNGSACADPAQVEAMAQECLRISPVTPITFSRTVRETVVLSGQTIKAGEAVVLSLMDANHDSRIYPEPGTFDATRVRRRHLTYGHGPHHCLGAPLANLQLTTVLQRLFTTLPALRLQQQTDAVQWQHGQGIRTLARITVTW